MAINFNPTFFNCTFLKHGRMKSFLKLNSLKMVANCLIFLYYRLKIYPKITCMTRYKEITWENCYLIVVLFK